MAVEIKYVVVRKGEEKMTFASKKEADAYDKMLDMAEVFSDWLGEAPLVIDEEQRERLGMFLAENKEAVQHILRTSKMPEVSEPAAADDTAPAEAVAEDLHAESGEPDRHEPDVQAGKTSKAKSSPRAAKAA